MEKRKKIVLKLLSTFVLCCLFFGMTFGVQAAGKKNIYLFEDGSYSIGVPYKENTRLMAIIGTRESSMNRVQQEIQYKNGTLFLNQFTEESLSVYADKMEITGGCKVNAFKVNRKMKVTRIAPGGVLDYGNGKSGKAVTLGSDMVEWKNAYYCTTQIISADNCAVTYSPGKPSVSLGARVETPAAGGGALEYRSMNTNVVTVDAGGNARIIGAGSTQILITAKANGPYQQASRTINFTVTKAAQTISANVTSISRTYGNGKFGIGGRTTSGGTVTYSSSNANVVKVDAQGMVEIAGAGTAKITLTSAETANYFAAPAVVIPVTVAKANQTLSVTRTSYSVTYGSAAFSVKGTSSGPGKVSYSSSKTSVAVVDANGMVTIKGVGTANITIQAAETVNYNAAPAKVVAITVAKADQKIDIKKTEINKRKSADPFSLEATLTGGTKLKYESSNLKVAKVSASGKVTLVDYGKVKITISAAGNANYNAASKSVYVYVIPNTPSISGVTSTVKSKADVTWKKVADATGYLVEYSTDSSIPDNNKDTVRVSKPETVTTNISGLKAGKTYYFRVRSYKSANGSTTYSSWSKILSVKVKK